MYSQLFRVFKNKKFFINHSPDTVTVSVLLKVPIFCRYYAEYRLLKLNCDSLKLHAILEALFTFSPVSSSLSSSEKKLLKVYGRGVEATAVDALLNRHHASGVFDPLTGIKIAVQCGKPVATQM